MSLATYNAPGVAAYLADTHADLEDDVYRSKALTDDVRVKRWNVYRG